MSAFPAVNDIQKPSILIIFHAVCDLISCFGCVLWKESSGFSEIKGNKSVIMSQPMKEVFSLYTWVTIAPILDILKLK